MTKGVVSTVSLIKWLDLGIDMEESEVKWEEGSMEKRLRDCLKKSTGEQLWHSSYVVYTDESFKILFLESWPWF